MSIDDHDQPDSSGAPDTGPATTLPRAAKAPAGPDGYSPAQLVDLRRHLHQHPELSGAEHQTARFVAESLRSIGLDPAVGAHGQDTGVVALVEGTQDGPTLAWRADIDALPIEEATGAPYASCNAGVMHACGHDVHTTIGLGIAARLKARRSEIRGRVKLIFQPAEEGVPGSGLVGAEAMARAGVLTEPDVEAIFAAHCMPSLPTGTIGVTQGAVWAGSDAWTLTIRGRQTHGAYPHNGIDPVHIAGHVIVALQGLVGRAVDARDSCVISTGRVEAKGAFNIIPQEARLVGLVRTLDANVRETVLAKMRRLVEGICAAHGAECELSMRQGALVTANDPELTRRAEAALEGTGARLVPAPPQLGAEDFASFSTRVPASYFLLGVGNAEAGITHPIHSPLFDVDERCLPLAVDAFSSMLIQLAT